MRGQSGASDPASTYTAWATIATAASLSPWTQPAEARSPDDATRANATSTTADGSVNPSHAATPPAHPARSAPIAIPSWLLVGPGSDWQRAR